MIKKNRIIRIAAIAASASLLSGCAYIGTPIDSRLEKVDVPTSSIPKEDKVYVENKTLLESKTQNELVDLYRKAHKYPSDLADISSYIGDTIIASSNSASEALSQTISAYTDGYCLGKTSEIVFEDDYTYVVNAGWEDSGARSYSANVMSFKDACAHYERYVGGEFALTIKDEEKIKRYIDLIEASGVASMGGHKFLCSEVSPVDDAYIYENWQFKAVYGDWGLQDELMIVSRRYSIADGGTVTFEGETTIKQMFVNRLGD